MKVVFESLTSKDTSWYERVCLSSAFPKLSARYNELYILFVDGLTETKIFSLKTSQYLCTNCKLKFPSEAMAMAEEGTGVIIVRVDILEKKSRTYQEFILLEEFCHLVDYDGNSAPQETEFWEFLDRYKKVATPEWAEKVARLLNSCFNHFCVNRLLMKYDLTKWLMFKSFYYGMELRMEMQDFFENITEAFDKTESLEILVIETIKVVSFLRAVETFLSEHEGLRDQQREKLQQVIVSVQETATQTEHYAKIIDLQLQSPLGFFSADCFTNKQRFFGKVTEFWIGNLGKNGPF